MFLRWRRSLPTEKARVAGAGDDDDADVGRDRDRLEDFRQARAHLGRDRVIGVRPVQGDQRHVIVGEVLDEHGLLGLRADPPVAGRSRAHPIDWCLSVVATSFSLSICSGLEIGQPAQRPQARHEEVLAAAVDDE